MRSSDSLNDFGGNFPLSLARAQYDYGKSGCADFHFRMFTSNSSYSSLKYKYRIKGSVFVMSEPPASDPKRPELKDLVIALRDLVECHALGLQLDLPESTLKLIDKHHDSKDHLRMMLSEWLQFDPEASWEKLATALDKIGKNAIAANVRRREFVSIAQPPEQESKRSKFE